MSDLTYLPRIDARRLREIIHCQQWSQLEQEIAGQRYERLGLDRLLTIAMDLRLTLGTWSGFDVLDIGCNSGLFSIGLAALGNRVLGLDSGAIDTQGLYRQFDLDRASAASGEDTAFVRQDIREFVESDDRQWDVILLLSVAHHWEFGYAYSGRSAFTPQEIQHVMDRLLHSCRRVLYYECPVDEPGFAPGYGRTFLERYATGPLRVSEVALTVGPNGYIRQLLRVERI